MEATRELEAERDADSVEAADGDSGEQPGDARPRDKDTIEFEAVMQRGEAATYFGALIDGLRHGQLQFRHGKLSVSLAPAQQVAFEVKASRKGDEERVAFELEWRRNAEDAVVLIG